MHITYGLPLTYRSSSRSFIVTLSVLVSLGGCTNMGNHPPSVAPPPVESGSAHNAPPRGVTIKPKKSPPAPPPSREVHAPAPDPAIRTASIDPKSLLGLDPDGVQKRLGAPARMENSTLSRKWIYAAPGCSFSIFFYPNVNSTTFRALKYGSTKDDGKSIDSSDACVRKILTARSNADN